MHIISNIALITINETLFIQLISFLIFLFLINRIMFKPLQKTIQQREEHINGIASGIESSKNQLLEMEKNLKIHGAIELDGCYACHKAHSTDINSLLTASFPKGLYAPAIKENFAMCFDCHDGDLITNSANNKNVTGFRNGETNLHFLHINGEKGRNCNNCHDMHSSVNDHLILKNVMFGNWQMPLNYQSNETGGSCTPGCHGETIYVR